MKLNPIKTMVLTVISCLSLTVSVAPATAAGLLTPKTSNLPALDIKDHKVNVVIEDGYAITTVDQTFYNPHTQDLEAVYSFPVPEKAAVCEFTMWIDGKPVSGEVLEKKKAREVYEEQKAQDKKSGITEKNGYKTFDISVFPVRAGQETKIRLGYFQPVRVDTAIGRYLYPLEEGGVDEEALAFWTTNETVTGTFSFDLVLKSAYPVNDLRLPSHPQAQIAQNGDQWTVHLDNYMNQVDAPDPALTINNQQQEEGIAPVVAAGPGFHLNKDIVVYYRLADNLPGSVDLVAYKEEGADRGTFMLTVTPGMDLQPISGGRDWVFILDVSGSMEGKYATLAEGVSRALQKMSANDRFRIVLFNSYARELTQGYVPATPECVKEYIDKVKAIQPDQGTNVYDGLVLGLKGLDADRTASFILVTDGVANVGVTQQKQFIELVKKYDIRLFTFIMGNSANQPLLEVLTRVSNGFAINISNSDDIIGKIMEAQSKVNFQALHGASLKINGVKTADITPLKIGSVYRGQQLVIFGHYFGGGQATVSLEGQIAGIEKVYSTQFDFPDVEKANPEIERLWAYASIERMSQEIADFGENADIQQSITDLGVEFSLVTDYTSMVVVAEEEFQKLGIEQRNKLRLQKESNAQQLRAATATVSHRVDNRQPMFTGNAPTFTGGAGALDPLSVALVAPLLWGLRRKKNQAGK